MPRKQYKITVLIDSATVPDNDPQFLKSPKETTTEYDVIQAIRQLGHKTVIIPVEDSLTSVAKRLKQQKPDLVFNLTEEFKGERRKDKVIAAMLENLRIPFTGTGSKGLALCRDKILCKQILAHHRINVPNHLLFPRRGEIKLPTSIKFPMIVKPAFEDGSEGISNASIVTNKQALKRRVWFVTKKWKQAAIAEEYIKGREFYVAILGNKKLTALPIRECIFSKTAGGPRLATYRVKWDEKYQRKWNVRFGFAKLNEEMTEKICRVCKKAYKLLQLKDYGRVDLRLTADKKVVVLEVNANPDVANEEELAEGARKTGMTYKKFIAQIISIALGRTRNNLI